MDTNTEPKRPSLLKQLLGAIGGAAIALVLYQGYKLSAPAVTAWLVAPQSQITAEQPGSVSVNQEVDEYRFKRIAARAKEIYQRFAAEQGPQATILPRGIEVTQPQAQSSSDVPFVDITAQSVSSMPEQEETLTYIGLSSEEVSSPSSEEESSSSSEETVAMVVDEPVVTPSSEPSVVAPERTTRLAGKKLPQSGVGTAVATIMALGATAMLRRRKRK